MKCGPIIVTIRILVMLGVCFLLAVPALAEWVPVGRQRNVLAFEGEPQYSSLFLRTDRVEKHIGFIRVWVRSKPDLLNGVSFGSGDTQYDFAIDRPMFRSYYFVAYKPDGSREAWGAFPPHLSNWLPLSPDGDNSVLYKIWGICRRW